MKNLIKWDAGYIKNQYKYNKYSNKGKNLNNI